MQLPGVLGPLPGCVSTVTVPKALLQHGRFLMQLLGMAVGSKLACLRLGSALPCSRHLVRFVHHLPPAHTGVAIQSGAAAQA
jgi:hypothetical protein